MLSCMTVCVVDGCSMLVRVIADWSLFAELLS